MIVSSLLYIQSFALTLVLTTLNAIIAPFPNLSLLIPDNLGLVFGNIFLLDSFLPVTEMFYLFTFAIAYQLSLFGFKIFMLTMELSQQVAKTFIRVLG